MPCLIGLPETSYFFQSTLLTQYSAHFNNKKFRSLLCGFVLVRAGNLTYMRIFILFFTSVFITFKIIIILMTQTAAYFTVIIIFSN